MPNITVTMCVGRTTEQKRRAAKALTDAIVCALEVKPEWVTVVFEEVARDSWAVGGELLLDSFHSGSDQPGTEAEK